MLNIAVTPHAQYHLGGGDDAIDSSRIHESTQCRAVEGEGSSPTKASGPIDAGVPSPLTGRPLALRIANA